MTAVEPWIVAIVDDEEDVHAIIKLAAGRTKFFGRPVEFRSALSGAAGEHLVKPEERTRFAVAFVDVVMEKETSGLELVAKLRGAFGPPLQLVLNTGQPHIMAAEEVAKRFEISNYLRKTEATPERIRTLLGIGIRNFRIFTSMQVLCDSLQEFVTLFESATTVVLLNRILVRALNQYAAVFQFQYLFVEDLSTPDFSSDAAAPWRDDALDQLRALDLDHDQPATFRKLTSAHAPHLWGYVITPLGGSFEAAVAFRFEEAPSPTLFDELRVLLRSWALTRESLVLKQQVLDEQRIQEEAQRERRESIAQMVAGVAHEVNTPLGVANAAAAMIEQIVVDERFVKLQAEESVKELMSDLLENVALIRRNVERADRLINSFKKLSVGQLVDQRAELDIAEEIEHVIGLYNIRAKRRGLTITVHRHLDKACKTWMGYSGYLSQVLLNLLENASRYAYPDGPGQVDVTISSTLEDGKAQFQLAVADHGSGIPEENLPVIFQPFFTTGRDRGGSGLGLAIIQNIVSSVFKGHIECTSKVGHGTTFTIHFGHCGQASELESAAAPREDQDKNKTVNALKAFITIEQKLAAGRELTVEEQVELPEVRAVVNACLRKTGTDRRSAVRIPAHWEVPLRLGGETVTSKLVNVSHAGAAHLTLQKIATGSSVHVRYSNDPSVDVSGEVVACSMIDVDDGQAERGWRVQIKFDPMSPSQARNLKLMLAQLLLNRIGLPAKT